MEDDETLEHGKEKAKKARKVRERQAKKARKAPQMQANTDDQASLCPVITSRVATEMAPEMQANIIAPEMAPEMQAPEMQANIISAEMAPEMQASIIAPEMAPEMGSNDVETQAPGVTSDGVIILHSSSDEKAARKKGAEGRPMKLMEQVAAVTDAKVQLALAEEHLTRLIEQSAHPDIIEIARKRVVRAAEEAAEEHLTRLIEQSAHPDIIEIARKRVVRAAEEAADITEIARKRVVRAAEEAAVEHLTRLIEQSAHPDIIEIARERVVRARVMAAEQRMREAEDWYLEKVQQDASAHIRQIADHRIEVARGFFESERTLYNQLGKKLSEAKDYKQGVALGIQIAQVNFPCGSAAVIGSANSSDINSVMRKETWKAFVECRAFEAFWDDHATTLQRHDYSCMQCLEDPTDIPAYVSFAKFMSELAGNICHCLGGACLMGVPSFLVHPKTKLRKSVFSTSDLVPDLLWSARPNLNAEEDTDIVSELKRFKVDIGEAKFSEALGQLVKVSNLLYGRLYTKSAMMEPKTFVGVVSDGVRVQTSYLTLSMEGGKKPDRILSPELQLVQLEGLTEIGVSQEEQSRMSVAQVKEQIVNFLRSENEGQRLHKVDTQTDGFKEMVFAIYKCLKDVNLKAASQEEADLSWQKGQVLQVQVTQQYIIGRECLPIKSAHLGRGRMDVPFCHAGNEFEVIVKKVLKSDESIVVLLVTFKGQDLVLKMGPRDRHRQVSLAFSPDWERWFQVERDMYFRGQICPFVCGSAFLVRMKESSRPAFLMEYEGTSLDQLEMSLEDVLCMSKQLYWKVLHMSCEHGVYHNDICPMNICRKNDTYHLIDWGFAGGECYWDFVRLVHSAFPAIRVFSLEMCANLEFSSDRNLGRTNSTSNMDLESLLFCCLKILNGRLPWSEAAAAEDLNAVIQAREESKAMMIKDSHFMKQDWVFKPLVDNWLHGHVDRDGNACVCFH